MQYGFRYPDQASLFAEYSSDEELTTVKAQNVSVWSIMVQGHQSFVFVESFSSKLTFIDGVS